MHVLCFIFFSTVLQVGRFLWGKQWFEEINSSRNLEKECCTAWHSHSKLQFKYFRVFGCQSEDRFHLYWWNPNTQSSKWCLWWSLVMVMLCLHLLTWPQTQHRGLHQVPGGGSIVIDGEVGFQRNLLMGLGARPYKLENINLDGRKFL